ncbi:hypothetical protein B9K03_10010 [Rothia sp. Olga]|nr:hypothetical protein B9K03_10010 [Rothia sp. Olga]
MRSESEGRTNIGAEVIDDNLSFFGSFRLRQIFFFKPLVHEPNECVYTAHTNRCFLIAQLLYRFRVAFPPFCLAFFESTCIELFLLFF